MKIRVFLADDHELVRYALRSVIEAEGDIEVIGEAGDGDAAIEGAIREKPDVLVLDLRMPGQGGVEVCRRVHEESAATNILILTSFDEDEELFGVLAAGACGYLLKDTRPERIVHAIRAVADGQAVFDSAVASRIINGRPHGNNDLDEPLSDREMEVLQLMAKGMSNKEIGRSLWIGETTVKTHVSHILRKLGQADRTQAVLAAVKAGLVRLGH
ncbi:MAG TPA: response regulator transcription factor [Coriobacteriia bacterium]|nr:response regulator transcription factor [Coriobacteriia bacterium]